MRSSCGSSMLCIRSRCSPGVGWGECARVYICNSAMACHDSNWSPISWQHPQHSPRMGITSTAAKLVCRAALALNGDWRTCSRASTPAAFQLRIFGAAPNGRGGVPGPCSAACMPGRGGVGGWGGHGRRPTTCMHFAPVYVGPSPSALPPSLPSTEEGAEYMPAAHQAVRALLARQVAIRVGPLHLNLHRFDARLLACREAAAGLALPLLLAASGSGGRSQAPG